MSSARPSRRQFLRFVGGSAAALLFPSSLEILAASTPPRRVVVLGAGLAGLTAAHELIGHGHEVVVLEARALAGGRVYTMRHPFDDQLYAEVGGEWIHPAHRYILHYVRKFGLELLPDPGRTGFFDGSTLQSLEQARAAIPDLEEMDRKLAEQVKAVDVFERPDRSHLAALDQLSYLDLLHKVGASERAIDYQHILVSTLMTVDPSEISALHMLYEFGLPQPPTVESRIQGGNSLLIAALANSLGDRVRLGSPATVIRWDTRGVEVRCRQGGTERREPADHVIVAIPATEVRYLRFEPALPKETTDAYSTLLYGRVMKVVLQARRRFWEEQAPGFDEVLIAGAVPHVYHSSDGQPGPRGLLTSYASAAGADLWGPLDSKQRLAAARALLGQMWPAGPKQIERGASWYWNTQPWIRGSYAYFAPGQMTRVRPLLRQAVGRIHFAGEHTAVWQGYMNGAVESGLRAAAEIEPAVEELFNQLAAPARAHAPRPAGGGAFSW